MSCSYADGLSEYENKGVLGLAEEFDNEEILDKKCEQLANMLKSSKHVVVHTGAGISTSAGIPDFRGPNGVWTLEKKGIKPSMNITFEDAIPTKTHMAIKALINTGYVHYIVSQNIDGLHLKSGIPRKYISELHGNMFIEECHKCHRQFIRKNAVPTVGKKLIGTSCRGELGLRGCRGGLLKDTILDWEHDLPEKELQLAVTHSLLADLNIALGTTLQIMPSGSLPLKNLKLGGEFVICNLQPTKYDKKANLKISAYVDTILIKVLKRLNIELPIYSKNMDPTKTEKPTLMWHMDLDDIKVKEKLYTEKLKLKRKISKSHENDIAVKDIKLESKDDISTN